VKASALLIACLTTFMGLLPHGTAEAVTGCVPLSEQIAEWRNLVRERGRFGDERDHAIVVMGKFSSGLPAYVPAFPESCQC